MDYYEINTLGKIWIERLSALPTFDAADTGRIMYHTVNKMTYECTDTAWVPIGIAPGTKMLFYQDTAPLGWTIDTSVDDAIVYFTKGSAAGGNAGGAVKASSTWTQPNHTHGVTTNSHIHTGPSHLHTTPGHVLTTAEMPSHAHIQPFPYGSGFVFSVIGAGYIYDQVYSGSYHIDTSHTTASTGSNSSHAHGDTGYSGTGDTSSNGGETVTSANGATAITWRPLGNCVIICTKN